MKAFGLFLLLLLPVCSFSQIRFVVEATGMDRDYILVEKPRSGNYFPTVPEMVLQGKKSRFLIETEEEIPGFLQIDFGRGYSARVFLEPGRTNSLSVDLSNFERSLKFSGPQEEQNDFLNKLKRQPLSPPGADQLASRSFPEEEKKPKDYYMAVIDQIESEKKILARKGKKKFSAEFIEAVEQDITFYYASLFAKMVARDYQAFAQNEPSRFNSKWAYYWEKVFGLQPLAKVDKAYSEYYLLLLDYYLGVYQTGYLGDALYPDPDLTIGEQFLEYDRLLWRDFSDGQLEYALAAMLSKRALLGGKEPILFDLFQKYKNDFPGSTYLQPFEAAVAAIGIDQEKNTFSFPDGIVNLDADGEINSIDELVDKFKGKVVYLDIWATWCSPCLFEFRQKKPLEEFIRDKDIALVFISVDNEDRKEKWQKTIVDNNLKGYHLLANYSLRDELIDQFGDGSNLALPHYSIYDKKGRLADKNAKQPSNAGVLFQDLLRYID